MYNLLTITNLFPLISIVFILTLGLFVWNKDKKGRINVVFFVITLIFTLWEFSTFMMFNSTLDRQVDFWDRLLYLGIVFLPALQYQFSLFLTEANKSRKILLIFGYIFGVIFFFLSRSRLFVDGVFWYKWGAHTEAKLFHHFFIAFFFFYIFALIFNFLKKYKKSKTNIEKYRSLYFIVAFAFLNIFGGLAYLPAYRIPVYPIPLISPLIFTILISYAIVSYRLLDIKPVLRNSTVYLMSLLVTLIPAFILKYWLQTLFPNFDYWIDFLTIVATLSVFPYLKNRVYKFSNRYLFTSLYDAKEVIKNLSDKLGTTLETGTIYQAVTEILSGALHMKAISFLTCGAKAKNVRVLFNSGLKLSDTWQSELACRVIFGAYSAAGRLLVLDELATGGRQDKAAAKMLSAAGIELLVPLTVKDKSVGVIALGAKESRDSYNSEDLELLKIVSTQTAIALENALLYEETKQFNVKLVKEVDRATGELKKANQELKTLDQAKSDFISIASHQLRTPLTVIKGYGSMMLEGSFGQIPKPIEENLQKIYDSNERLIALVEDLLNISRIESGRLQFNFEAGQLEDMAASVTEELAPNAVKKGLVLKYNHPKKPLPAIRLDKTKLRQVVINLIDNAVKYTEKGSITVDVTSDGASIKLCVADTGMGVSAANLPNLFKKFSRGEATSVIHTEGTGLGLYVGKMMIEAHKGHIWAESPGEGKGSRFCFEIPINTDKLPISKAQANPKLQ